VFFQNSDDEALFRRLSIIPRGLPVRMSKGCGVDAARFRSQAPPGDAPSFLFVGRLLEAKGLRDLAAAARIVRAKHPDCVINILGPEEHGPGAVPLREVRQWEAEGLLRYLGEPRDVRPYLERATVVVLPSWREGTPGALLEAMSMGRAVIAADAPGSREVVRPGVNGFLVPLRDPEALAAAMESCILDPALVRRLGAAGRSLAEGEFSALAVARAIMREMGIV
jgi:glycosyltransferase involved in cell wall biosynthesis